MSTLSPQLRRSGFSLIEVAIALAIFVFGALAIVRIFPPALGVIRNNESRASATQLSETLLTRSTGKLTSIPDSIYDGTSTNWNDIPLAVVGTPSKNGSLPRSPLDIDFNSSALNHFKYIKGESHVVRAASDGTQFVFLNVPFNGTVDIYREDKIDGVQIQPNGQLDFTNATDSSGNTFNGSINSPSGQTTQPPTNKDLDNSVIYYVSYRWLSGAAMAGVIDEPILLPESWSGVQGRVLQGLISGTNHISPGAVAVRYRQRVSTVPSTADNASRGYLIIPIASGVTAGEKLSFDYSASDWRNIVDESGADRIGLVSLPIPNLDQSFTPKSLLTYGNPNSLIISQPTPSINYKTAQLTYSSAVNQASPRVRTIYRPLDGWAIQPSITSKSYIPFYTDAQFTVSTRDRSSHLPEEFWREYFWNGTGNLYFHPSEAGKTISVSFGYFIGANYQVVNQSVITIRQTIEDAPGTIPTGFFGASNPHSPPGILGKVARAEITDLSGNTVSPSAILGIQGLSIQARTAWQNGDRYEQVIVPGYRTLMQ